MTLGPLHGFRDFYPAELAERAHIMRAWREVARRFAFVEYDGPPLESLELYTRKSGDEIVGQLYNFVDKGGREVALRPEMTPTVARMVGARANALRKPVRWFSMPQLFRYERAQKGRLREHFQLNVDIFGEPDVTADAELVAVAIEIMRALGLTSADVQVRASDRRILTGWLAALGVPESAYPAAYAVIDKLGREPRDVAEEKLLKGGVPQAAVEPILGAAEQSLDAVAARVAGTEAAAHVDAYRRFAEGVAALTGDGAQWLRFDLSIVRGLAYYTGIVFELFDAQGELRAICGGGRYDGLLKGLGGPDMPALGFGMGDVVLGELLRQKGLLPTEAPGPDFWVTGNAAGGIPLAMQAARELRAAGFAVEYALRAQKPDKQFKAAQSAGARYVLQLHEEFADNRVVTVREAHRPSGGPSLLAHLPGADIALDQVIAAATTHRASTF
ncbi:MAG: histidine--tRNA ligase [Gemmatimonadetes bacterium]|nr:histidine--tRNA ligase [Gemmatimonadota bacterium]